MNGISLGSMHAFPVNGPITYFAARLPDLSALDDALNELGVEIPEEKPEEGLSLPDLERSKYTKQEWKDVQDIGKAIEGRLGQLAIANSTAETTLSNLRKEHKATANTELKIKMIEMERKIIEALRADFTERNAPVKEWKRLVGLARMSRQGIQVAVPIKAQQIFIRYKKIIDPVLAKYDHFVDRPSRPSGVVLDPQYSRFMLWDTNPEATANTVTIGKGFSPYATVKK